MAQAKPGDRVKVHYTGKLGDGQVFDTSIGHEPLQFTLGHGDLIADFEDAVIGMEPGNKRTAEIPAGQAYGPYRQEMVIEVDRGQIPSHLNPEVGQLLGIRQASGETFEVMVTEVSETVVTLDANHPLAGKDLTFDIELLDIG